MPQKDYQKLINDALSENEKFHNLLTKMLNIKSPELNNTVVLLLKTLPISTALKTNIENAFFSEMGSEEAK